MAFKSELVTIGFTDGLATFKKGGADKAFCRLPFDERTVGYSRFNEANASGVSVARLIRVPYHKQLAELAFADASALNVSIAGGGADCRTIYKCYQAQKIKDTIPECIQFSLSVKE